MYLEKVERTYESDVCVNKKECHQKSQRRHYPYWCNVYHLSLWRSIRLRLAPPFEYVRKGNTIMFKDKTFLRFFSKKQKVVSLKNTATDYLE